MDNKATIELERNHVLKFLDHHKINYERAKIAGI